MLRDIVPQFLAQGSVRLSGDATSGSGTVERDVENIEIDLHLIPSNIHWIVIVVNMYTGGGSAPWSQVRSSHLKFQKNFFLFADGERVLSYRKQDHQHGNRKVFTCANSFNIFKRDL